MRSTLSSTTACCRPGPLLYLPSLVRPSPSGLTSLPRRLLVSGTNRGRIAAPHPSRLNRRHSTGRSHPLLTPSRLNSAVRELSIIVSLHRGLSPADPTSCDDRTDDLQPPSRLRRCMRCVSGWSLDRRPQHTTRAHLAVVPLCP